ncbi:MAG: PilZ domain-containing protein [Spirochaetales bacterium]|nr:PilZ domain-containing protein [Spirochaetales bacterium]
MEDKLFKSRINTRISTSVKASFSINRPGESVKEGVITNFSRSGLFIKTENILPVNSHVVIDILLPEEDTSLHLVGEVRNIVDAESAEKGMGIKIQEENISKDDKNRLKEFFDLNHIYGWFC